MIENLQQNKIEEGNIINPDIIKKLEDYATDRIEKVYSSMDFHNIAHTENVSRRFYTIINFLKENGVSVSERDIQLGKIGTRFHDVFKTIKSVSGSDESMSAKMTLEQMEEENKKTPNTFTPDDEQKINNQIMITIPGFDGKTVVYPSINEKSTPIEIALILADLGGAGMDGALQFKKEGDAVFREENLDIKEYINSGMKKVIKNNEELQKDSENIDSYKTRMFNWSKNQITFAEGRKEAFEKEISGFPKEVQEKLKKDVFNKFEESISYIMAIVKNRENMTFQQLAIDMGYDYSFNKR